MMMSAVTRMIEEQATDDLNTLIPTLGSLLVVVGSKL